MGIGGVGNVAIFYGTFPKIQSDAYGGTGNLGGNEMKKSGGSGGGVGCHEKSQTVGNGVKFCGIISKFPIGSEISSASVRTCPNLLGSFDQDVGLRGTTRRIEATSNLIADRYLLDHVYTSNLIEQPLTLLISIYPDGYISPDKDPLK